MKARVWFSCVVLVLACKAARAEADDLPRHGVIGLVVGAADVGKPEDANPLTVKGVVPGGAGEAAGIQSGDVIREIDGAPVPSSTDLVRMIGRHLAGDRVSIQLIRDGREILKTAALRPRPFETSPDADVLYRSVMVEGARRRVIITRPRVPGPYRRCCSWAVLGVIRSTANSCNRTGMALFSPLLRRSILSPCVLRRRAKATARVRRAPT